MGYPSYIELATPCFEKDGEIWLFKNGKMVRIRISENTIEATKSLTVVKTYDIDELVELITVSLKIMRVFFAENRYSLKVLINLMAKAADDYKLPEKERKRIDENVKKIVSAETSVVANDNPTIEEFTEALYIIKRIEEVVKGYNRATNKPQSLLVHL